MRMTEIVAVMVLAGCTHENNSQAQMPTAGRQVNEAQQEAADSYQRAAQAQRDAQVKAEAAAGAERRALDKQHEAQQAQQDAIRARQDAEEAQRQAMIIGREAERQASQAQQRAIEEQPQAQSQSETQAPIATVTGRVRSATSDALIIERTNAPDLHLRVEPNKTSVMENGQQARTADLGAGEQVTVSYRLVRDQPVAIVVQGGATQTSQRP